MNLAIPQAVSIRWDICGCPILRLPILRLPFFASHSSPFARDNLSWQDRELATVGALAALQGVDPQMQSHMRISRNVGLAEAQLQQVVSVLRERVGTEAADRAEAARISTASK
ncbi:carboxymuconolactone decarboxylase family protein [Lysobacter sp. Root76]|uniref:carboxymuconolactone decarboxylase family protein n=1 Tax=Lysobacter sp. Root76 TaxID=1736598 RepID=UPI001F1B0AC3|nr:carboxymuconolactone decarboxylase family protein [Lysobacter sp. Root76]